MTKRKLLIALSTAAVVTAGFGASVLPASAELRTFQVTLAGGKTVTCTIDVPAGTPVSAISCPGVVGVVVSVVEITAPSVPEPDPGAPAPGGPGGSGGDDGGSVDAGADQPRAGGGDEPRPRGDGKRQKTTGGKARARDAVDAVGELEGAYDRGKKRANRRRGGPLRDAGGAPTLDNPTISLATPGPAPIGVPNFFIDKFRIPPFLLSIYQAAGIEYGVRWEVLAAINEIETDYGRNLNVSSAGALGWMQFMPATWKAYGVDANGDKKKDPYNPVDAIFAAARYLKAAGADEDLARAIFAYNHADWYVDSVLMRARLIGGMPTDLVGSLTGLTQGMFPVHAKARYADDVSEKEATRRMAKGQNAAIPVEAEEARRSIDVFARSGSPVIAVQDGRIVKMGRSERLGNFIKLRDAYGNTYTYARLKTLSEKHPVPKKVDVSADDIARELELPKDDPAPTRAASAGSQVKGAAKKAGAARTATPKPSVQKERLFAEPRRPAAFEAGGEEQIIEAGSVASTKAFRDYFVRDFGLAPEDVQLKKLKVGSKVIAGTILGRIGRTVEGRKSHVLFEIRPAGRGAPRIDPKPILDGWKLLESTAIYRAKGKNPFFGNDARTPTIGQILLMGKSELERRVLRNPRIEIYDCGRRDIKGSRIDRRVLATLEFLAASGLRPTVTSLTCGHSYFTASGNVSHHSSGNAVDIAKINGIPIYGNQGKGSITDIANRRLLTLQGTMKPAQIISLMKYEGADNTYAMGDHADHIHVGFQPLWGANGKHSKHFDSVLKPSQWVKLIDRLSEIDNPTVPLQPSKYAITVTPPRKASTAHRGE
ncbi:MAG TPA: lytic murein transglycosylase [Solirubrobacteraceae bacterium]|nr:lytic murein transglycosylase [Solirubrobacteraceae bacterium]